MLRFSRVASAEFFGIAAHAEIVPDSVLAKMFGNAFIKHEIKEQFTALAGEMTRRHARAAAESPAAPTP